MTVTANSRHFTASMVVIDPVVSHVLLVWHNATGKYVFPGGHVDPDETAGEAALREVYEETGVLAQIRCRRQSLPGMRWEPSPWLTAEIPAPAKPERPGKPAEPAHSHIDFLFVGVADSLLPLTAKTDEVARVIWVPVGEIGDLETRAEIPMVALDAWAALVGGDL